MKKNVIRYSEAFKRQVVKEIEEGKFRTFKEAREKYGIKGCATIAHWLKKYGKEHLLPRKVRIEMPDEQNTIKQLKKRIKQLEKALADAQVGEVINQAYFEVLCEQVGITDIEGYKKKLAKSSREKDEN